jgi:hypothetical protein
MNLNSLRATKFRKNTKQKLIEYKGGKCQRCGYSKDHPSVYDFHHRNPEEKEFGISKRLTYSFERLKKEVDKCDLLCKNCHAEVHEEEYKSGNYVNTRKLKKCKICKKNILFNYKFCSLNCSALSKRKVSRPSKKHLENDLNKMSWSAVGRKYGVSDNAVRNWAKQYGIPIK